MKNLTGLWVECTLECASITGVNADKDIETVLARVEHEGISFLTISLPQFGSDLERGLELGCVDSNLFHGFKWKGGLPLLFRGFLRQVFHPRTGVLHPKPNVEAIRSLRQICHLLKKVELPCTPEREKAAVQRYISTELELRRREDANEWTDADYVEFSRMATLVFGRPLSVVDRKIYDGEVLPKHGSGKTADTLRGNHKWRLPEWSDRLEEIFSYTEFGLPNHRYWDLQPKFISPEHEQPAKVTLVPKTLKTPRVIVMEPTYVQYMQQAVLQALVSELESANHGPRFVGFTDQLPNQRLAQRGSLDGKVATLDLSDASDRVLNSLVMNGLVRNFPWLGKALDATRSRCSKLPLDGGTMELRKFASMGSATCFPVEAMVFATVVFLGIERSLGRTLTRQDLRSLAGSVRVYGDDIVVPTEHTAHVIEELTRWGLVVNTKKSFWTGRFRESCGGDYFAGEWVTPIRCKTDVPRTWDDVDEFQAWVALSNNLHQAGLWRTAQYAAEAVQETFGRLAVVNPESQAVGLYSFVGVPPSDRMDVDLQKPVVRAHTVKAVLPSSKIDGVPALLKCLNSLEQREWARRADLQRARAVRPWFDEIVTADPEHLSAAGRPKDVSVRRRWVAVG